jgi:hypothetical protein
MTNNLGGAIHNFGAFNSGTTFTNAASFENSGALNVEFLTNNSGATILNDSGATLDIAAGSSVFGLTNNGTLTNNGVLDLSEGGLIVTGTLTNNGAIQVIQLGGDSSFLNIQAGGVLSNLAGSSFTQTGGQIIVDGTLNLSTALDIQGGNPGNPVALSGTGTINGIVNNDADVAPGDPSTGTLTIDGGYSQLSGTLTINLGGTGAGDFGVLDVTNDVILTGTIDFTAVNGFTPGTGDAFTFLRFGTLSFESFNINFTNWTCPADDICSTVLGPHSMTLEIAQGPTGEIPEPSYQLLVGMVLVLAGCSRRKTAAPRS